MIYISAMSLDYLGFVLFEWEENYYKKENPG